MTDSIRQFFANRKLRDYATGYAFVIPALAMYVIFVVYPVLLHHLPQPHQMGWRQAGQRVCRLPEL